MLTQAIKEKILELFNVTPDDIGVSYGKKMTNGEFTGELAITFLVKTKRPLEEIPDEEMLPSSVIIDGVEYLTDVIEVGEVKVAAVCDNTTLNNCYSWQNVATPPGNQLTVRPLKGGVSILSAGNNPNLGTLGFIGVDTETQALVGVTNNHVVINSNFYTSDRNLENVSQNELNDRVYQTGETGAVPELVIGKVLRYVPLRASGSNQVDGAIVSVASNDISNSESFKQYGVNYNSPLPFATTAEINNLLTTNPKLYSSGRTTGAKGDNPCGLTTLSISTALFIAGYKNNTAGIWLAYFTNVISFTRTNPNCPYPISAGDSGSALIADFNGVRKIIGLVFAESDSIAYANRIDDVAAQLGISAWDGTPKAFINLATQEYRTIPGGSSNILLDCNGSTYWQIGLLNTDSPCSPITSTTTTTFVPGPTTTTSTTAVGPTTTTTTTTASINFTIFSSCVDPSPSENPTISIVNFIGTSSGSVYSSNPKLTEAEALANIITSTTKSNPNQYDFGFFGGFTVGQTYWVAIQDINIPTRKIAKSVVALSCGPTITTTTTMGLHKPFTAVINIGLLETVCPFTNYTTTYYFTGPGTYPTVNDTIYNLSISGGGYAPINLNGSWMKMSNGNAITNNSESGIVSNDVTCNPTTTTTTTLTPTTTTTTTEDPRFTTTTTTTTPIPGIYTLYMGFERLNTVWITFN